MHKTTKQDLNKINQTCVAWETLAPDAIFAGMTLKQFKDAVKPILDWKDKLATMESEFHDARQQLQDGAKRGRNLVAMVVSGVKADPNYGEDSSLYSDLGYIRKSARKTGLTRKKSAVAAMKSKTN